MGGERFAREPVKCLVQRELFFAPELFTFGDVSRTMPNLRTDGIHNLDLRSSRISVSANVPGCSSAEKTFNLLNTPQFGAPNTSLGSQTFGQITSQANQPRLVQVAAKFLW